jgi:hypothetical protein
MMLWSAFMDDAGNVIETHKHAGDFKAWVKSSQILF